MSNTKKVILVVDDTPDNLKLMNRLLEDEYSVKIANNGELALEIAQSDTPPDLILLDVMMPVMDGYAVCAQLKANPKTVHIPVIFLTAKTKINDETKGLELGAVDYIAKPISPPIVLARVKTHLEVKKMHDLLRDENSIMKKMQDFLHDQNSFLEAEIQKRTTEMTALQDVTIQALASLAETRDNDTGNHIRRTQLYVKLLAEKLRFHPRFTAFLDDDKTIDMLFKSAPLHDIGKVGISDSILLKPGKLEPHEFEIMKTHTVLGLEAMLQAERMLGLEIPFFRYAKEITHYHHEKWNGTGYPDGLLGDAIPISARLMALADVYDALVSRRVYKLGMPHEKAAEIIKESSGSHFDPDIVTAFVEIQDDFQAISATFADFFENEIKI